MTEAEWLQSADLEPMLGFLRDKASDRKLRLFAVACCRVWPIDTHADGADVPTVVALAERWADGDGAAGAELHHIFADRNVHDHTPTGAVGLRASGFDAAHEFHAARLFEKGEALATLLREIIGNPFRPVQIPPPWRTSNVVGLAQAIYEERAFERMPILADALEDAGCTDADVLGHSRSRGPHVRGCWLVDLLLGKK
jgi:hypothetical protein